MPQLTSLEWILLTIASALVLQIILPLLREMRRGDKDQSRSQYDTLSVRLSSVETRVGSNEAAHHALALRYEGNYGRHDEALDNLEKNMMNLTGAIDKLVARVENVERNGHK